MHVANVLVNLIHYFILSFCIAASVTSYLVANNSFSDFTLSAGVKASHLYSN